MTVNVAMLSNAKALNWTYGLYCSWSATFKRICKLKISLLVSQSVNNQSTTILQELIYSALLQLAAVPKELTTYAYGC